MAEKPQTYQRRAIVIGVQMQSPKELKQRLLGVFWLFHWMLLSVKLKQKPQSHLMSAV
ncbi:MAG: hypothetical protein V7L20_05595 [Nostoc sp.]